MTSAIEVSERLVQWAKLADYTLTPASITTDGRPVFWSALGKIRLFVGKKNGWFVITDSDRLESENFVLAASSMETIEKYLFGRFCMYIRSGRNLPRVGVPLTDNEMSSKFNIQTRDFDGIERYALTDSDGSTLAISSSDSITGTAELKKLALYLTATLGQIEASATDPEGKPLFERR